MVDANAGLGHERTVTLLGDLHAGAQVDDVGDVQVVDEPPHRRGRELLEVVGAEMSRPDAMVPPSVVGRPPTSRMLTTPSTSSQCGEGEALTSRPYGPALEAASGVALGLDG